MATGAVEVIGTQIGTTGDTGHEYDQLIDGDPATYASKAANGVWWGFDIGSASPLTRLSFMPRKGDSGLTYESDFETAVFDAKIQISSASDFSSDVTTVDQIPEFPNFRSTVWNHRDFTSLASKRYVRWLSANGTNGNLAGLKIEVEASGVTDARPCKPELSPWGGKHDTGVTVTITSRTTSADIYYTVDGSDPDDTDTLYSGPFNLTIGSDTVTVKAIAIDDSLDTEESEISTAVFHPKRFVANEEWYDVVTGDRLKIGAGGILKDNTGAPKKVGGFYWWYGMDFTRYNDVQTFDGGGLSGVWCAKSADFYNWQLVGNVLNNTIGNGLKAAWKLDEASGNRADSGPGGHTLTDTSSVGSGTGNIYSLAAQFDGSDRLTLSDHSDLRTSNTTDFTVTAWVYSHSNSGTQQVYGKRTSNGTGSSLEFMMRLDSGVPTFYWGIAGGLTYDFVAWGSAISTDTWHLITIRHSVKRNICSINVDHGTPVEVTPGALLSGTNPFTIGACSDGLEPMASGSRVQEVVFFNQVLSDVNEGHLYNAGSGRLVSAILDAYPLPISPNFYIERPFILYNEANSEYVLWAHIRNRPGTTALNLACVATSSAPDGPFTWRTLSLDPDGEGFKDCSGFVDDDDTAYIVYTTDNQSDLIVSELDADYYDTTGTWVYADEGDGRESPSITKFEGDYYLFTSASNYYNGAGAANGMKVATASDPLGTWSAFAQFFTPFDPVGGADDNAQLCMAFTFPDGILVAGDFFTQSDNTLVKQVWLPFIGGEVEAPSDPWDFDDLGGLPASGFSGTLNVDGAPGTVTFTGVPAIIPVDGAAGYVDYDGGSGVYPVIGGIGSVTVP